MIKILTKIDGINNVLENHNLLEIEFEKNNIIKIFHELKDNTELHFNQLLDITAVDYPSREFRFDLIYILQSLTKNKKIIFKILILSNSISNKLFFSITLFIIFILLRILSI